MIRISNALAIFALLLTAPAATAASELGNAGDLPATAQDLSGETVAQITGDFPDASDVDLYKLCLSGGGTFSATTVGGSDVDTQLYLFDANGLGVYGNDDTDGVLQSMLPAEHALTPAAAGTYYLAVSPYNLEPRNDSGSIFLDVPGVLAPLGPGASDPVTSWFGRTSAGGNYAITVTGANCAPPDTTAPAIDLRSPVDATQVAVGAHVVTDFSCADEAGGSGLASCVGTVADGALLDTSVPGPVSVTVTARDVAGNERSVRHTANVVAGDDTAPLIDLAGPLDGAVYLLDARVLADYSCVDEAGGSGLASCKGTVPNGKAVDTGSVGAKQFTVDAADAAGNTSAASAGYQVVYDFEGFLWPVRNPPHVNRWRAGVPVPIRFELGGDQGRDVIEDGWPQVAEVECGAGEEPVAGKPAAHPRWFRELVFRHRRDRYVMVWKTERDWAGSCRQFMLKLDDGTVKRAEFDFTRRWHH